MEGRRNSDERALRVSLTGARVDSDLSSQPTPAGGKRKQPELSSTGRFKVVSQLVLAMNRFKASLNPTYTFGKRADSGSGEATSGRGSVERGAAVEEATSAPSPASPPPETAAGARKAYHTHGHRTNYMLRPLPPTAKEVKAAAGGDGF